MSWMYSMLKLYTDFISVWIAAYVIIEGMLKSCTKIEVWPKFNNNSCFAVTHKLVCLINATWPKIQFYHSLVWFSLLFKKVFKQHKILGCNKSFLPKKVLNKFRRKRKRALFLVPVVIATHIYNFLLIFW